MLPDADVIYDDRRHMKKWLGAKFDVDREKAVAAAPALAPIEVPSRLAPTSFSRRLSPLRPRRAQSTPPMTPLESPMAH